MKPILVEVVDKGLDWPAWVQAVGSVAAIVASVWLGRWLQDREREKSAALALRQQAAALVAIGRRCVEAIADLNTRAVTSRLEPDNLGYLQEEAAAAEAAANAIDLMALRSPTLIKHVADLQQAARTSRRRLSYRAKAIREGQMTKTSRFKACLEKATKALEELEYFDRMHTDTKLERIKAGRNAQ